MSKDTQLEITKLVVLLVEMGDMLKELERAAWNDPSGCPICDGRRIPLPVDRYEWHADDCRLASLLMRFEQTHLPSN